MGSDIITAVAIILIGAAFIFLRKRSLSKQTEKKAESNSETNAKGKERKKQKEEKQSRRREGAGRKIREFNIPGMKKNVRDIESGGGGTEFMITERIMIVHTDEDLPSLRD